MLEGFGAPDPFGLPSGIFANRVNTGNPYGKQPDPSPFQLAPRFVGLTAFGSPVTFYETECDGSLNHYIEPDSGCRSVGDDVLLGTFNSSRQFVVFVADCTTSATPIWLWRLTPVHLGRFMCCTRNHVSPNVSLYVWTEWVAMREIFCIVLGLPPLWRRHR